MQREGGDNNNQKKAYIIKSLEKRLKKNVK